MTEKFNIKLTFSDTWKRAANSLLTLSKTQEKHEVHRKLSSTRKIPMDSLFSWKFFYSFLATDKVVQTKTNKDIRPTSLFINSKRHEP